MKYVDRTKSYIAIAKAIIKENYVTEPSPNKLSDPIDYILVHPIKQLFILPNLTYKISNIGFIEINTNKQVIKRLYNSINGNNIDLDIKHNNNPIIGDVFWYVNEENIAENLLNIREIIDYKHLSKDDINFKLDNIRIRANMIGLESYASELKRKNRSK